MGFMDMMLRSMGKETKEKMMINMMPLMMEGQDINELMPKMMVNMFKDVSVDDVVGYLAKTVNDNAKLSEIGEMLASANLMARMMMKSYRSRLGFDETVQALEVSLPRQNWHIPDTRDLQKLWQEHGISDAPRIKILYLCNPQGGAEIIKSDDVKSMSVMMPMGLSVYETSRGDVEVAFMNLGMMSMMFSGRIHDVLKTSAENLENALQVIFEEQ